ncbi:MAG: GXWXG domain-containing protein [Pseudomonadota bacterium]
MTSDEVIAWFDSLPPVQEADMLGNWRGEEVPTDHPMDGLLVSARWHGKRFEGPDAVHPLVHQVPFWGRRSLNPALLPLGFITGLPGRDALLNLTFPLLAPLFFTSKPRARLRVIRFRGREHAAMCYDAKPINDVFARIDEQSMLGWMDFKGMERPYFFKLTREG